MRYSIKTLNYPKIIILSNVTHIMSMANPVVIGVETLRIDSGYSLDKEFTELIIRNTLMILCQTVNQVDSCHDCVPISQT